MVERERARIVMTGRGRDKVGIADDGGEVCRWG